MGQNRALNHVYLIPIFLYLALVFDGIVMNLFAGQLIDQNYVLTPRFILLVFVLFTVFFPKQPLFLYALLFGIVYDSFYSGVIGLYAAGLATIMYVLKRIQPHIVPTPIVMIALFVLAIGYLEIFIFGMYTFLGYADLSFEVFLSSRLGPTLLLNIILFIACYYPLYRMSQWMYQ